MISRQESEYLLSNEDGNFLVRESNNPPGSATLAIKFGNETKNYKVYYDGAFYVGEKRFDNIYDLVHDGLISFYIEKHASQYIAMMSQDNNYSESPYVASRTALLQARQANRSSTFIQQNTQSSASFAIPPQIPSPPTNNHLSIHQQLLATQRTSQFIITNSNQSNSILFDKENRAQNLIQKSKSNAIFDRFDIMNSEKPHRFKAQNFKGPHWCDYCLNFMWGLVSQGVKCQDCGFQAHKKCSECAPPDCEPQMKFIKRVFGVDLTTLVKATSSIRPIIVEKCIDEIEKRKGALETEGLYRVSGFNDAIEDLKLAFDRGDNIDLSDSIKYNDIHLICSLLKMYLRQLPIPLITFEVYNRLIDILSMFFN
jgi:chimaerin